MDLSHVTRRKTKEVVDGGLVVGGVKLVHPLHRRVGGEVEVAGALNAYSAVKKRTGGDMSS